MTRLSAWIVNHRSGAFCVRCVESLVAEWRSAGGAADELEVVVVDSGSGPEEERWFGELRRLGARVVPRRKNLGYARGMAVAAAHSFGGPDDLLLVLNPDLWFLPGSVAALVRAFDEDSELGVAGPRAFIDESRQILLPPQSPPDAWSELADVASASIPAWARARARRRAGRALAHWTATGPRDEAMLSGACLALRRGVLERVGGLFDARYPLYYEDADLARRLARAGVRARLVPDAEVLHHWSRSAGAGVDFAGEPARRHALSRRRYLRRWHGRIVERLSRTVREALERRIARRGARPLHACIDLGVTETPPRLSLPEGSALVEWSATPHFALAAGTLAEGGDLSLSAHAWSWLFPGRYWARALDPRDLSLVGAWTFEKRGPARAWPVDPRVVGGAETDRNARVGGVEGGGA